MIKKIYNSDNFGLGLLILGGLVIFYSLVVGMISNYNNIWFWVIVVSIIFTPVLGFVGNKVIERI